MAVFSIPSDAELNIAAVEQVKASDFVVYSFVNGYFYQFLCNDQALKNQITTLSTSVTTSINQLRQEVAAQALVEATNLDIDALFVN